MHKLKVGFISPFLSSDKDAMSGTVHSAFQSLRNLNLEIIDLQSIFIKSLPRKSLLMKLRSKLENKLYPAQFRNERKVGRLFETGEKQANYFDNITDKENFKILIAMNASNILPFMKTKVPIIYVSDYTAFLYYSSYPERAALNERIKVEAERRERASMNVCQIFCSPAETTLKSAEANYGVARSKLRLAEYGAHVKPRFVEISDSIPSKESLELLCVAIDPVRKRVAFCQSVVSELRNRGWCASLNFIGSESEEISQHPHTKCLGRLNLSSEQDRVIHEKTLASSHWLILPSIAEAYGIAPAEAAHFARPSIVSNAGGLATVVQDQHTGIVMDLNATVEEYCDRIEEISSKPERYNKMRKNALERAHSHLNWDVWARKIESICQELI